MELIVCDAGLTEAVIGATIEVHRQLGPGLLESVYEQDLMLELAERNIRARNQVEVPVSYKGRDLGLGFRADVVVEDSLVLELKACSAIEPIHMAQIINYLKLMGIKHGFLMNFNSKLLKDGIKRVSI